MTSDSPSHNIVLTGFMGTGKTTVGRLIAAELGYAFIDTDDLIVEAHGPIDAIFKQQGESAFRRMEHEAAVKLSQTTGNVISTGGGFMLNPKNAAVMSPTSAIFCLVADPAEILKRVMGDGSGIVRPLLSGPDPLEKIQALLTARQALYAQFPQISTDGKSPEAVAAEIIAQTQA